MKLQSGSDKASPASDLVRQIERLGVSYCLDMFDDSPDPAVFTLEHDGSDAELESYKLSEFLASAEQAS